MKRENHPIHLTRSERSKKPIASRIPRLSRSTPTTPNHVRLDVVNNLSDVLKPLQPIVHEAVQLGNVVQRLDNVLPQIEPRRRRSARIQEIERQGGQRINLRR